MSNLSWIILTRFFSNLSLTSNLSWKMLGLRIKKIAKYYRPIKHSLFMKNNKILNKFESLH